MHFNECIYVKIANKTKYYPLDVKLTASHLLCTPRLYLPVVCHVTLNQVAGCKSGHERELSGHDGGADNAGQLSSVLPGAVLTGSLHTQHLQTHTHTQGRFQYLWVSLRVGTRWWMCTYLKAGLLGGQVGSSSHGAQLDRGHGAADVEVLACWSWGLHQGDAVAAAHRLRRILQDTSTRQNETTATTIQIKIVCCTRKDWLSVLVQF